MTKKNYVQHLQEFTLFVGLIIMALEDVYDRPNYKVCIDIGYILF